MLNQCLTLKPSLHNIYFIEQQLQLPRHTPDLGIEGQMLVDRTNKCVLRMDSNWRWIASKGFWTSFLDLLDLQSWWYCPYLQRQTKLAHDPDFHCRGGSFVHPWSCAKRVRSGHPSVYPGKGCLCRRSHGNLGRKDQVHPAALHPAQVDWHWSTIGSPNAGEATCGEKRKLLSWRTV